MFCLAYGTKDVWKTFCVIQFHAYLGVAAELVAELVAELPFVD